MINVPFYQTEWLGIDLVHLAKKIGHDVRQVPSSEFYKAIYQLCDESNFCLEPNWIQKKEQLSHWLGKVISHYKDKKASMISIGCGFGIVETALIEEGFLIDLQECQPYSLKYLKNQTQKHPSVKVLFSKDLHSIATDSYDVVMCITSTYCLEKENLKEFLASVSRILKKDGIFIWYETALSLGDMVNFMKTFLGRISNNNAILWGWKRRLNFQTKIAKHSSLRLLESCYFDNNNHCVNPKMIFGLPFGYENIAWQAGVYRSVK